ncbi:MAG: hypothetical protein DRI69_05770 [Bacteroidetes bacterium]|nr:MAG: hypothetical protein DRI69_05770 [Bacteroidota bacterium]
MKLIISLTILILSGVQISWSQPAIDSNRIIKVLSFNILHGRTMKGDFDLDVIAKVIIDANPDLVALQEVDFKTNRAKKYDLVTELGWRTKMVPLFGRAMDYDGGEYGEGVLSRYTILQSRNVPLPYYPGSEPRAALEIITILPSGDTIAFVGTHLDHQEDEKDRLIQARQINRAFAAAKYPTLLVGDLNAIPGSSPIEILEGMWSPSFGQEEPKATYPSDDPVKKIDYVFYYPLSRWRVLATEVICDTVASDHCAYLVTIELLMDEGVGANKSGQ